MSADDHDDGPCATCGKESYKKHHLPIPDVCRAVNAADNSDMRRPVCSGCYKWARRHFTGEHAKCVDGELGASCASRFRKARDLGVVVVGWAEDSVPPEPAAAPEFKAGGSVDEDGDDSMGMHTGGGHGASSGAGAPPPLLTGVHGGSVVLPTAGRHGPSPLSGRGALSGPGMTPSNRKRRVPPSPARGEVAGAGSGFGAVLPRRPSVSIKRHRRSTSNSSEVSVISFSNLDDLPLDAAMFSLDSNDSLWGFSPTAMSTGGFAEADTAPAPSASAKPAAPAADDPEANEVARFGRPDPLMASGASAATSGLLTALGSPMSSLGIGAAEGFGGDVARHVIHVDYATGAPHPTCAWVKFSGSTVREVLRAGTPATVLFLSDGADATAAKGHWTHEASQFSVMNAPDADGIPVAVELSVGLPVFPLARLLKATRPGAPLCVGLWVVPPRLDALGGGAGGAGAGAGSIDYCDAVMLAILVLEPVAVET